ncbi:MAG: glycosyltransferase family 4 protein [Chloroflexi bacterium]|uniref:glycosyltransferase family 4 protein n=1 Tax=Candidatus Flexifilum breve TaxID=3140694 RepID=UPI0031359FE0|nr:glycosyltransferase family 4 protein [Chloroflexota bacterium]
MHIGLNAHLLSGSAGYRSAGIHGYIDGLLRHLPRDDWRFTAFVGAANHMQIDGVELRRSRLDTESPLRRIVWEQALQPWQLGAFDLYHALAFVAPLPLSTPMIVTIYDLSFIHYPERLPAARRLYLRLFTGLTCRRARRVQVISQSTGRDVERSLGIPASKIDLAQPGYDPARFYPLPADEIAAFKRAKNLPERFWLFIGTLEPRKNLTVLLDAYAALPVHQRLPLILGGGKGWDYDPIFAAVERHHLGSWVQFPGFIPADELRFWYNSAEAFIYPSVFEGFGLPVLEAQACGTPVIMSDASSLPEVAGDAGLTLAPQAVSAWTEALRRAVDDTQWRNAARERGLVQAARFQWQATADKTIESYRKALHGD